MKAIEIPKDGLTGLKENWKTDALSGFLVFLLALPLSLGIAKASEFPIAMGVLTAMVGGIVVAFFAGSRLTIKGPAAGLITICSGAVLEFGGGIEGWHMACGVIVVTAVIQFVLGVIKVGSLSDFFPHSAVHGMLAAIGIIIFSKQIHVLLGIDPATLKGMSPIALYKAIPHSIMTADPKVSLVGLISLFIIFGLPQIKNKYVKKIPTPLIVLLFSVPAAIVMDFKHTEPAFDLVKIGDFWGNVGVNSYFTGIATFTFWKYVIMFLFVNSLESLLTVKAIDGLDPWKRKSDYNKDLRGLAIGNGVSGLLGGLPMISEVARSSANVNFGARTRWANFFHGVFLLLAMVLMIPVIEMTPNTALAAMLISVSYRLASPKEFIGTYRIGPEQLVIFLVTIVVTVAEDLLLGVAAGILTKFIFHIINGAPLNSLFKAQYDLTADNGNYHVKVKGSATFSNFLGYKKLFDTFAPGKTVTFNFSEARLVDFSFMDQLHHFEDDYHQAGGKVAWTGMDKMSPFSDHPLAARKVVKESPDRIEIRLTSRQIELRTFAEANDFVFYPQKIRSAIKYKGYPIHQGNKILSEENVMTSYLDRAKLEIADIALTEGVRQLQTDTYVTVINVTELNIQLPDFALEPEDLWSKVSELVTGKDIDFTSHPKFSNKYYLRGEDEAAVKAFFSESLIRFFETHENVHVECHRNRLLIYKKRDLMNADELERMISFTKELLEVIHSPNLVTVSGK